MKSTSNVLHEVTVRPIRAEEVEPLQSLRLEALLNHPEAFGEDYEHALAQPPTFWEELVQGSRGDGDRVIFVADHAGTPVGMAGTVRSTSPKSRHSAMIWGVYVRPGYRGQGIARGLVQACCGWAREKGVLIIKLGVVTANPAAIRCYEQCGFSAYGVEPKAFYVNGEFYDLMRMFLEWG